MKISQKLSNALGLSEYESKIYISLQNNGPMHIKNISKFSDIPRTAVYSPLLSLIKDGLVSESVFGKRKYYSSVPFENLKSIFEHKKILLDDVVSELERSKTISSNSSKLDLTFHAGIQGIKAAGLIFLNETKDKTWYSFENLSLVTDRVELDFENFYIKERVSRGIKSKMILSSIDESKTVRDILKNDINQLRKTIILSPHEYPFDTTVVATRGLALLINPNENPFALLIRNTNLANTFMTIHKCIWDRYQTEE